MNAMLQMGSPAIELKDGARVEHAIYGVSEVKFAGEEQPGVFTGYAAVFGNLDSCCDVLLKGAFRDTLREWKKLKKLPPMLINHGGFGAMDDVPIGVFDKMEEDDVGLRFDAHLIALDTETGKRIYAAMKAGALDGMSIGYRAKEFSFGTKPDEPRRTLKKVDLVETSVVTFPSNPEARISEAKGELTIRDAEKALRDVGFSTAKAKAILADGFKTACHRDVGAVGQTNDLAAALKRNAAIFQPHN